MKEGGKYQWKVSTFFQENKPRRQILKRAVKLLKPIWCKLFLLLIELLRLMVWSIPHNQTSFVILVFSQNKNIDSNANLLIQDDNKFSWVWSDCEALRARAGENDFSNGEKGPDEKAEYGNECLMLHPSCLAQCIKYAIRLQTYVVALTVSSTGGTLGHSSGTHDLIARMIRKLCTDVKSPCADGNEAD